jgi:geranylgeranyl diphosphate synthase type II
VNLQEYIDEKRAVIESSLRGIFATFKTTPDVLREAMEHSLFSQGKRVRPVLTLASCDALGGDIRKALPFGCAIEMIHTYSLIHDDLPSIDNDDLRRGKPTCHKAFGEAVAILAGDALLTEAFRVMADPRFTKDVPPQTVQAIVYEVARAAGGEGMVAGQVMDVLYEGQNTTTDVLNFIHENKTAALIRASVRVGAMVAGADAKQLDQISRFGQSVGLAFQIRDDLLDAEGDEARVGKRVRKDTAKQTYVKHYGIEASKKRIDELTESTVQSVAFLGDRAEVLVALARRMGKRSS